MPIRNCKDRRTAAFMAGERIREFHAFAPKAVKAITKLQAAVRLGDLRYPPSNHFEALVGDRAGQYSIRVDGRWRVCFRWAFDESQGVDPLLVPGEPYDVEITDDHKG